MEDMSHVRTHEAQMEDVKVWDGDFLWNFQVGPEGGNLVVRDVLRTFPQDAQDMERAYGLQGCNVLVKDVSLNIPPGALEKEITVTMGISWDSSNIPFLHDDQVLVGPAVYYLPSCLHFERPVKLSFHCKHEAVDLEMLSRDKATGQWMEQDSYTSICGMTTLCPILTGRISRTIVRRTRTRSWPRSMIPRMLTTHSARLTALILMVSVVLWLVFGYSAASVIWSVYTRSLSVLPVAQLVSWMSALVTLCFTVTTPAVVSVVQALPYFAFILSVTEKHSYHRRTVFTQREGNFNVVLGLGFLFTWSAPTAIILYIWMFWVYPAICWDIGILWAILMTETTGLRKNSGVGPFPIICAVIVCVVPFVSESVAVEPLLLSLLLDSVLVVLKKIVLLVLTIYVLCFVIYKIAPVNRPIMFIRNIFMTCSSFGLLYAWSVFSFISSTVWDAVTLPTTVLSARLTSASMWPAAPGALQWVKRSVRWRHVYSKLKTTPRNELVRGFDTINVSTTPYFTIGRGTSNTDVYLGLLDDGREMAVKKVAKSHKAERINEGEILVQLDHRNIVSYMTQKKADGHIYTALKLCEYTLDEWLRTAVVEPDWNRMAAEMVKQLLQALKYLHDNRVLHCDLTPQNVLVKDDKERCLKLGDFGLSCRVPSLASCAAKPAGTRSWQAREVLLCPPQLCCYSASSDIQEAGMVVFYMMSQRIHPYGATVLADVERNIINDNPDLSAVTDRIALDFVRPMLAANTADRPTAETLLRHPYVWTDEGKYEFLAAVGDEREVATCDMTNPTSAAIEAVDTTVLPLLAGRRDWGGLSVLPELNAQFQRQCQRSGYSESVCRLLRTLRNIKSHYGEQPARAKAILGHTPSPFTYFNTELPALFPEIYSIIKNSKSSPDDWTQRELLKKFF